MDAPSYGALSSPQHCHFYVMYPVHRLPKFVSGVPVGGPPEDVDVVHRHAQFLLLRSSIRWLVMSFDGKVVDLVLRAS